MPEGSGVLMLLCDREIADLCFEQLMIFPFVGWKVRENAKKPVVSYGLDSTGYDIRLADTELLLVTDGWSLSKVTDVKNMSEAIYPPLEHTEDYVTMPAHSYALGVSVEKFNMPNDITGVCVGKSTYARAGLQVNITPLEPGWRGYLTLEFANLSPRPIRVYLNEGIAKVMFYKSALPGHTYEDGKYQDQSNGVQLSKV